MENNQGTIKKIMTSELVPIHLHNRLIIVSLPIPRFSRLSLGKYGWF